MLSCCWRQSVCIFHLEKIHGSYCFPGTEVRTTRQARRRRRSRRRSRRPHHPRRRRPLPSARGASGATRRTRPSRSPSSGSRASAPPTSPPRRPSWRPRPWRPQSSKCQRRPSSARRTSPAHLSAPFCRERSNARKRLQVSDLPWISSLKGLQPISAQEMLKV